MRHRQDDVICFCADITFGAILRAIEEGAATVEDITDMTDAGLACGTCIVDLEEILEEHGKK